jgi:hypothetical protein
VGDRRKQLRSINESDIKLKASTEIIINCKYSILIMYMKVLCERLREVSCDMRVGQKLRFWQNI